MRRGEKKSNARGGGLNVWHQRDEAFGSSVIKLSERFKELITLEEGTLVVLDGFMPHQIQGFLTSDAKPFRMTAVMHFLYRENPHPHWEYWF